MGERVVQPKASSSTARASGVMVSQSASGIFVRVTKSALMKTLATPSISSSAAAVGSSAVLPFTKVAGPPTAAPTLNFKAFGFGVLLTVMAMATQRTGAALP